MFKRIFLTITVLIFFLMADKSYGESTKSMLLIVTESSWDAFWLLLLFLLLFRVVLVQ